MACKPTVPNTHPAAPNRRPRCALTFRQIEILEWVQGGKTAWEIGRILGLSGRSVDGHLRRIYVRLDVRTRLQAVLAAQDLGLLSRPTSRRPGEDRYVPSGVPSSESSSSGSTGGPPSDRSVIQRST